MSHDRLSIQGVSKSFAGVYVLSDVDFTLRSGEVHAIVGENGAGKSTFIKILSGVYRRDSGTIRVEGENIDELTPALSQDLGIVTIYQERNLIPHLSVGENILLGNIPINRLGVVQWKELFDKAQEILDHLNLPLNSRVLVSGLGSAEQQAVEIAKALYKNAKIVIMDEPTASLTKNEIDNLFNLIAELKKNEVAVIYISHRLDEIFQIADRVMVLRDGKKTRESEVGNISKADLVKAMVGEELDIMTIHTAAKPEVLLEVKNLSREGVFRDINLTLHAGEIIGIAGMVGSGRTEVVRSIAGIDQADSGKIIFRDEEIQGETLTDFIERGITFVPEDRDYAGIISGMAVAGNITLASIFKLNPSFLMDLPKEKVVAGEYIKSLQIATKGPGQEVQYLSGGNRQKVMLAKWLCLGFDVFIMDEPTQGVDVGAREEIHQIMEKIAGEGKGIIMVSSEMEEVLNMSNKIYVMNTGTIAKILTTKETTKEEVVYYAISKTGGE